MKTKIISAILFFLFIISVLFSLEKDTVIVDRSKLITTNYDSVIRYLNCRSWPEISDIQKKKRILSFKKGLAEMTTAPSFQDAEYFPKEGLIKNEEMAIKIAEMYWYSMYGERIYQDIPFVGFIICDSIWHVTSIPAPRQHGGNLHMEIKARNGEVISIGYSK